MSIVDFRTTAENPAELFLQIWDQASRWSHVQRDDAVRRSDLTRALMDDLLMEDDPERAVGELITALAETEDSTQDRQRGSLLDALQVIDEIFLLIHPRTALLSPARAARRKLPEWLVEAQEYRTLGRPYARDDKRILLPRGPFSTTARTMANLNGETLEDRFNALTAAPHVIEVSGRPIGILSKVVGHDAGRGVPAPRKSDRKPGREAIGVVVVAERARELEVVRYDRESGPHLDIRAGAGVPAAERLYRGVRLLGDLDIALAPELTMSEDEAQRYASRLTLDAGRFPRLSVAGSGASHDKDGHGRAANLSIMYNALGSELWRHRKVWPYAMTPGQVAKFRWDPIADGEMLSEELADGDILTVADLDGLGRVITLICQDFQLNPAISEAVRLYQPDWVLVPVLDSGTDFGRWTHQRAFELSGLSNARFVVASSLALAEQAEIEGYPDLPVAVMVGPKDPSVSSGATARAVGTLRCQHQDPMCGRLGWGDADDAWSQTNLSRPPQKPV